MFSVQFVDNKRERGPRRRQIMCNARMMYWAVHRQTFGQDQSFFTSTDRSEAPAWLGVRTTSLEAKLSLSRSHMARLPRPCSCYHTFPPSLPFIFLMSVMVAFAVVRQFGCRYGSSTRCVMFGDIKKGEFSMHTGAKEDGQTARRKRPLSFFFVSSSPSGNSGRWYMYQSCSTTRCISEHIQW